MTDKRFVASGVEMRVIGTEVPVEFEFRPIVVPNPFNILDDFDNWFEWERRVHFEGEDGLSAWMNMTNYHEKRTREIEDNMARELWSERDNAKEDNNLHPILSSVEASDV